MNNYSSVPFLSSSASKAEFRQWVFPEMVAIWLDQYEQTTPNSDIIETRAVGFSYLFDIAQGRLIAAWGFSTGKNTDPRPDMRGHPMSEGPLYHRGHAIAHTLGGETDINLVPQLGSVNVGQFRVLENKAVETPGALYFSYWIYSNPNSQKPTSVEQGLMVPGRPLEVRQHAN